MSYPTRVHDPNATLDYRWQYRRADDPWLEDGETITDVAAEVASSLAGDGSPVTVDSSDPADGGDSALVWLSGGTAGADYVVTVRVTTSLGRVDDRSVRLLCRER